MRRLAWAWIAGALSASLAGGPVHAAALDDAEVEALEQQAWADPERALPPLLAAVEATSADAPAYAEGLRVLGETQVWRHDLAALERVLARVDVLAREAPSAERRRDASTLGACLRAAGERKRGQLAAAAALLHPVQAALAQAAAPGLRHACALLHANVQAAQGHYEAAMRLLQAAILDADDTGSHWRRSELRTALSDLLWRVGQRDAAQAMVGQALRLARVQGDRLAESHAHTVAAIQLGALGREPQEREALEQALALARGAEAISDEAHCLANLSDFHLRHDRPAKALAIAERALPLARRTRNSIAENVAQVNAGLALILLHRTDEGLRRVRESVNADLRADDLTSAADSLVDLATYLERSGHPAEAYAALRQYRDLADETARRSRQRQLVELQDGFEAQQRQHERQRLQADNQLKEELWHQRELGQRFWQLALGAAALLVALVAWGYRRLRSARATLHADHRQVQQRSAQDPLTGLGNRRQFPARLGGSARGVLCLLDLDHFKLVNDRHGHAVGDAVLVEVAQRLRRATREGDLLVRWGGEEFLIATESPPEDRPEALAARLLGVLAEAPVQVEGLSVVVTGSIGYARFPLPGEPGPASWDEALALVDAALLVAKDGGRNRACGVRAVQSLPPARWRGAAQDLLAAEARGEVQLGSLQGPSTQPKEARA